MDWLGKTFEGTSHEISARQYNWKYGQNSSWISQPEIEEFDRAIAKISLGAEGKGKHTINNASQVKEDELLARALQESLKVGPPNSWNRNVNRNGNIYQPIPVPYSTGFRRCAGCNLVIDRGVGLSRMGAVWHPECFRCRKCNLPIADNEFSLSGKDVYHKSCYKENHHPRCDVCQNFIRINAAGFIEYKIHPFWDQKYCMFHDRDGTPRCCSCERIEKKGTPFVALNDSRKLCLECLDSAIMDTNECQPLYLNIQQYYESLNMKIEQKIPLLLVERQALNEARNGEQNGHYHMPETRGLCLSEEQTISTVSRQPRLGFGNRVPSMRIEPYKLIRHCEVTAILVLYGLPRLLTGSILAHEMMHAWLRLNGYRTLRQDVEEGICQVLGHMWLTSRIACISRQEKNPPFEKKLAEFFKHQIESDTSQVYGNGFRAGNRAVNKYGLQKTLHHIQSTGNFPY
uniref:protein DA1-related 1-like n=1 Tax=Erigeron canadensis TaxID=72917 RepID=UPI001CB8C9BD|nr:protein DA1-related 1-like [Erigeron canadensis]